jgi:hypothetical protein
MWCVNAAEAFDILSDPLAVLVEHGVNDAQFLDNVSSPRRDELRAARRHGWLRFEHGGGITAIPTLIEAMTQAQRRRLVVITDRDESPYGGELVGKPLKVRECCDQYDPPVFHHAWRRRAIENYIPILALERFPGVAKLGSAKSFIKKLRSLEEMIEEDGDKCRYELHLKKFFGRDDLAKVYDSKRCSDVIQNHEWTIWLKQDGAQAELEEIVSEILKRL